MVDYSLMAGRTDPFGMNETEEERQRRLAALAAQAQAAPQPASAQPVDPAQIFQRMLQVESGNRQFTPTGQTVTSPRGAMGAAQIMPATAMDPGYGVPNIFDLARQRGIDVENRDLETAKILLRNEPLNREFGQKYFDAMNRRFGTQGAVAAYNAGPGRVQQNLQQNQGQLNLAQLPEETQQYARQVLPQQPLPRAVPGPGVQVATGQGVMGGAPAAAPAPAPTLDFINQYQTIQDDPRQLLSFGFREDTPEWLRNRAKSRAGELLRQQDEEARARAILPTMTESDLARALREKTTGGSYLKAALFGLLGMEQSAMAEAAKLGIGKEQSIQLPDGTAAIVKIAANGTPIEGYNAQTGAKLTSEQLVSAQAGAAAGKIATSGTFFQTPEGQLLRAQSDERGGTRLVDAATGARYAGSTVGLTKLEEAGGLRRMDRQLMLDLAKKHGQNVLEAEKEYVALNGPFPTPEARQQFRQAYGYNLAQPAPAPGVAPIGGAAAPAAAPAVPQAPVAPAQAPAQQAPAQAAPQAPVAPAAAAQVPLAQQRQNLEVTEAGRKEIIKKAGDVIAGSDKLVGDITNMERAAIDVVTQKNNFGTILSGILPGERAVGELLKTQDAINTKNVMDVVNKVAASNAKMLGTNPTDRDLQFVVATKPDESWPPEAVADWLRKSADGTRRTLDFARKQIETGGRYIPETPQPAPAGGAGKTSSGNTYRKVQ